MDLLMNAYRDIVSSEDETSSDSDSYDDLLTPAATPLQNCEEEDGEGNEEDREREEAERKFGRTQMLADLGIFDLPPIEDLTISVPEQECIPIGTVYNIVEMLIIVAAKHGSPAIDLDSVLFLDRGHKILGKVLDVFGPVSEPMYMVRFNSAQEVIDNGIEIGTEVYFAPRTKHTAYVFMDPLFKQKGSDASWENDQEPPEHCLDYSDDEEERQARAALRQKKRSQPEPDYEKSANHAKRFQPRTHQHHSRGRGRMRGGHQHHQSRQPPNPFYMSLSNVYSAEQQFPPPAVTDYNRAKPAEEQNIPQPVTTDSSSIPVHDIVATCDSGSGLSIESSNLPTSSSNTTSGTQNVNSNDKEAAKENSSTGKVKTENSESCLENHDKAI